MCIRGQPNARARTRTHMSGRCVVDLFGWLLVLLLVWRALALALRHNIADSSTRDLTRSHTIYTLYTTHTHTHASSSSSSSAAFGRCVCDVLYGCLCALTSVYFCQMH